LRRIVGAADDFGITWRSPSGKKVEKNDRISVEIVSIGRLALKKVQEDGNKSYTSVLDFEGRYIQLS
jgi:nitroimidazol reductase NimA-like FMN-containing flavoprotein (pyridoxamine 5'-phosphate oxidase superfamily)